MNKSYKENLIRLQNNLPIIEEKSDGEKKKEFKEEMKLRIQSSLIPPIPEEGKNDWQIERFIDEKQKNSIFQAIKNNRFLARYNIDDLRKEVMVTPIKTLPKILKLIKKNPQDPELYMLSAICSSEFLFSYNNHQRVISGMKNVIVTGGTGLLNGALSIYNLTRFISSYYSFLEKLKREQQKVKDIIRPDSKKFEERQQIDLKLREVMLLLQKKNKVIQQLEILSCRQCGSFYRKNIELSDIKEACRLFESGKLNHELNGTTVENYIKLIQAIGGMLAGIPVLRPLFDDILKHIPESSRMFFIRKKSLLSMADFLSLKIEIVRGNTPKIKELCTRIFNYNFDISMKCFNRGDHWAHEVNSFYNQAIAVQISYGFLDAKTRNNLIKRAISSLEILLTLNKDGAPEYSQQARNHMRKLKYLDQKTA